MRAGVVYLRELIALTGHGAQRPESRRLPIVIACGNDAQRGCALARLDAIDICHPSDRGLRGGVNREPEHLAGLQEAAPVKACHPVPRYATSLAFAFTRGRLRRPGRDRVARYAKVRRRW